jgi:DNA-binding SARP family transcriptional activator
MLCVRLLGKFEATYNGQKLDNLDSAKVQELLSYLLLRPRRAHSREALASLLWGDATTAQSRKYLRQALWQLQSSLDRYPGSETSPVLVVETDWVRLNPTSHIWIDVSAIEAAAALAQAIPGYALAHHEALILDSAVRLYQGELLEGQYALEWCTVDRERLRIIYLILLDKLMAYCEAQRLFEAGIDYGTQILRVDSARERTHRQLMRLYYLSGDRSTALRQFLRCVTALRDELGVGPSHSTLRLHEQLRNDSLDESPRGLPVGQPDITLTDALADLVQLHSDLATLQGRLDRDTRAFGAALASRA